MNRFDWSNITKRMSTWLSILATLLSGAAAGFVAAPQEWRDAFPSWMGLILLLGSMLTGALVPVATSYRQKIGSAEDGDS